jgi:dihydropteroate synthase
MQLHHARGILDLTRPVVMGVLNVTPDSFSDGGRYLDPGAAVDHACRMVEEGAACIDVGGESTRPGAGPISVEEELRRVLPVVQRLAARLAQPVSVDTSRPEVMRAAVDAGAAMINDVRALQMPGALQAAAATRAAVCLMHMRGEPHSMQQQPQYDDVVTQVRSFLEQRLHSCLNIGIDAARLCLDPGFGFGKTVGHNLTLLRNLRALAGLRRPLLVGLSRKSMLQQLTGRGSEQRTAGSIALATLAVSQGARIVRAHDVQATVDAVAVAWAVNAPGFQGETM